MRREAGLVGRVILPRAIVVWMLMRLVVASVPLMAGLPFGSMPASPVGVVLMSGLLGPIDVRMRGERFLWANLGVQPALLCAVYAAIAVPAELALWVALL